MVLTLPFFLLLLDVWPLRRLSLSSQAVQLVREKVPFFTLMAQGYWLGYSSMNVHGWITSPEQLIPWGDRLTTIPVNYAQYLAKSFWPAHLAVLYPARWHWSALQISFAVLLLLIVSLIALASFRARPSLHDQCL